MSAQDSLIFIDTNIFLDFYRLAGSEAAKLLGRLKKIRAKIITSEQVEMEFAKNRQKRMLDSFNALAPLGRTEVPGFFVNSMEGKTINAALKEINPGLKSLKDRLSEALKNPEGYDSIYKAVKDIVSFESKFNLTSNKSENDSIFQRARQRFDLGYPPRKDKDTSIGDAINWEWIVECARKSGRYVIIVSRDGDYGLSFAGESYLNEWLRQEFSRRVGAKSEITLTDKLADALKDLEVPVTPAEEQAEKKLIETASLPYLSALYAYADAAGSDVGKYLDELYKSFEQMRLIAEGPAKRAAELLETQRRKRDEAITKALKPPTDPKS